MHRSHLAAKGFRIIAAIGVFAALGCIEHSTTGPSQVKNADLAVRLLLLNGNSQTGAVSSALPTPVTVRVLDANGIGVRGATVTFAVRLGGGRVSAPTAQSDSIGNAVTLWTLGASPGANQLTAILTTKAILDSVVISASAVAGGPKNLAVIGGDRQSAIPGAKLPTPISVRVSDALGNGVVGVSVGFAIAAQNGGGSVLPESAVTDGTGVATTAWTLGSNFGVQTLTATVSGLTPVTISAIPAGFPSRIRIVSGNGQIGRSSNVLVQPLIVNVTDAAGSPVAGAQVKWTQGAGNADGYVAPSPATTDATGNASVLWTLGGNLTSSVLTDTVFASLEDAPSLGSIAFTASARPQPRIRFIRGTTTGQPAGTQLDTTGTTLSDTLVVQVYDPSTNTGIQGTTVTWAPQAGDATDGKSVNSVVTTDNLGYAKNRWLLRSNSGNAIPPSSVAKRMIATAAGIGDVEFRAVVSPGIGMRLAITTPPSKLITDSTNTVVFTLTDNNGFPVSGVTLTFAVSTGGTSSPTTAVTSSSGTAALAWKFAGNGTNLQSVTVTWNISSAGPYSFGALAFTLSANYGVSNHTP